MTTPRQQLFERLPEIYRIRDAEQRPAGQFEAYLGVLDEVMAEIRDNVESLYHDHFIETCDDWVVPYIADLLGTSHLSGDPWTLRADAARTVHHRRRKGTLGAIESLTHALSGWAVHSVELRERLLWNQHLNHQRPDAGGRPPLLQRTNMSDPVRGGTVTLRDPAVLSFLNGPFGGFGHVVDVKPTAVGSPRYNLPNLGIFLWRLAVYTVPMSRPLFAGIKPVTPAGPDIAARSVRFHLHPMGEPMVAFNSPRFEADDDPPNLTHPDAVPGPMPTARLTQGTAAGRPDHYVAVVPYMVAPPRGPANVGLTLHIPQAPFTTTEWRFRGANLCAWEVGLKPPLRRYEIAIDPVRGRVVFGVDKVGAEANKLRDRLLVSATYGFSGPTGAHPIARPAAPETWQNQVPTIVEVNAHQPASMSLQDALGDLQDRTAPLIVEIDDSLTHDLDLAAVDGTMSEAGRRTLRLRRSLWIRAASGQRPVIRLRRPLAFRPVDVVGPKAAIVMANLDVRLEGLYLTRGRRFSAKAALIERAAVNRLVIDGCTLDPGGQIELDGSVTGKRRPIRDAMRLANDYGFASSGEEKAFSQTPVIELRNAIAGPLAIGDQYALVVGRSIIDAGAGVNQMKPTHAVRAESGDPFTEWGPPLTVDGMTAFGRMRVQSVTGQGGIWVHRLEARDNQQGCIKFSYLSGKGDRIPPHHGCIFGTAASLSFVSDVFGEPGYAQLRLRSDRRVLEQGPGRDAMGAFGYLQNSHKWKNINIRYREFMPVGIRPVLVPVT